MKTILPEKLETVGDVKNLIQSLIDNNEMYHMDDDATDLVGDPFTKDEADKLNELFRQAFDIRNPWELLSVSSQRIKVLSDAEIDGGYCLIDEEDIYEGAEFELMSGIVWIVDSIEGDLVRTSMMDGEKGRYRDDMKTVIEFFNEQKVKHNV